MRSVVSPWLLFLAGLAALAGCDDGTVAVDLRAEAPQSAKEEVDRQPTTGVSTVPVQVDTPPQSHDRVFVVLIGGFDSDPTVEQLDGSAPPGTGKSGLYQLSQDLEHRGFATRFFNWNGSGPGEMGRENPPGAAGIAAFVRDYHHAHPDVPLVIVGNSWGGQTALEVVTLLSSADEAPIAHLVLSDASSFLRSLSGLPPVPKNVVAVTNYYSHSAVTTGPLENDARVENIDLGDPANGFLRDHWARYDATNDWGAHIRVEWDPLIHEDIARRVAEVAGD